MAAPVWGLSISVRFVRMMGGEIGLESREGEGSRFSFTLRFIRAEELGTSVLPGQNTGNMILPAGGFFWWRIMYSIRRLPKHSLKCMALLSIRQGTVRRGVDKFAEASEGTYCVILMDIRMPVMDGLEAAEDNPPDGPKGCAECSDYRNDGQMHLTKIRRNPSRAA